MDLKQFFKFTPEIAKYYPQSNRIVNNYYAVPRVIYCCPFKLAFK